jgi:hypothetical protein
VSTIIFGHPFANSHPGEATILPKADARQGRLITDFGPLAGLLKDPTLTHLEPLGEFGSRQEFIVIDDGHVSFKPPTGNPRAATGDSDLPRTVWRNGKGLVRGASVHAPEMVQSSGFPHSDEC